MMARTVLLARVTAGQSARVEAMDEEPMALSSTWMVGVALAIFGFVVVCVVALMSSSSRQLPEEEAAAPMIQESEIETKDYNSETSERMMSEELRGGEVDEAPNGSGARGEGEALHSGEVQLQGGRELSELPEQLGSDNERKDHRAKTIAENQRKIEITIKTLIENHKNRNYEHYNQEGIMASIRHLRMLNLGNGCGGHFFVRELLLKLQQDSMESREAVKELEEKYPVEEKTFPEECDFWKDRGVVCSPCSSPSSESEGERSSERDRRYIETFL